MAPSMPTIDALGRPPRWSAALALVHVAHRLTPGEVSSLCGAPPRRAWPPLRLTGRHPRVVAVRPQEARLHPPLHFRIVSAPWLPAPPDAPHRSATRSL